VGCQIYWGGQNVQITYFAYLTCAQQSSCSGYPTTGVIHHDLDSGYEEYEAFVNNANSCGGGSGGPGGVYTTTDTGEFSQDQCTDPSGSMGSNGQGWWGIEATGNCNTC
jgi:hypothetical protein